MSVRERNLKYAQIRWSKVGKKKLLNLVGVISKKDMLPKHRSMRILKNPIRIINIHLLYLINEYDI